MIRLRLALTLVTLSCLMAANVLSAEQAPPELTDIVTKKIQDRVVLLNAILRHPERATIDALDRLTEHHEHGEEADFFVNSITDGNVDLGKLNVPLLKKVEKHLHNPKNHSLVLGHMRLALLAYNRGRAKSPPRFEIARIQGAPCPDPEFPYCYYVTLIYVVASIDGSRLELPATMLFNAIIFQPEGRGLDAEVTLKSLIVNNNEHLAWWR